MLLQCCCNSKCSLASLVKPNEAAMSSWADAAASMLLQMLLQLKVQFGLSGEAKWSRRVQLLHCCLNSKCSWTSDDPKWSSQWQFCTGHIQTAVVQTNTRLSFSGHRFLEHLKELFLPKPSIGWVSKYEQGQEGLPQNMSFNIASVIMMCSALDKICVVYISLHCNWYATIGHTIEKCNFHHLRFAVDCQGPQCRELLWRIDYHFSCRENEENEVTSGKVLCLVWFLKSVKSSSVKWVGKARSAKGTWAWEDLKRLLGRDKRYLEGWWKRQKKRWDLNQSMSWGEISR